MKKIFFICLPLLLAACGSHNSIIGTPIKLGTIEIAEHDFPKTMTWEESQKACADLGTGWRLPTKIELNDMYLNKDKIGGFIFVQNPPPVVQGQSYPDYYMDNYWSSAKDQNITIWVQNFTDGRQSSANMMSIIHTRAVRTY